MRSGDTRYRSATSRRTPTGVIEKGLTAVEWLHRFDPDASRQEIHGLLGQMLFSGEEGLKPTEALSGGETARLLFCRIMLEKPNVLLLDEPTNHLDLESINALNVALQKFDGTVLLVTHDQDLLEEVGTRVWHFREGAPGAFKGLFREPPPTPPNRGSPTPALPSSPHPHIEAQQSPRWTLSPATTLTGDEKYGQLVTIVWRAPRIRRKDRLRLLPCGARSLRSAAGPTRTDRGAVLRLSRAGPRRRA